MGGGGGGGSDLLPLVQHTRSKNLDVSY